MAKRFLDTNFLSQAWIRKLSPEQKCFLIYLMLECDNGGIIDLDLEATEFWIGKKIGDPSKFLPNGYLIFIQEPGKFFLPKFILYQYNDLSSNKNIVVQARQILKRHGLINKDFTLKLPKSYLKVKQKLPRSQVTSIGIGKGNSIGKSSFGKYENLFFGNVPDDLIELAGILHPTEKADEWHNYVENEIQKLGYQTKREVLIRLGPERNGRIDLVATKDQITVAIELDYRTPRQKSIEKVKKYNIGVVLLRDPKIIRKNYEGEKINIILPWTEKLFIDAWELWKSFKKQQFKFIYKPIGEQGALHDLAELSGGELQIAIAIIHQSIKKGWKGLFELKVPQGQNIISYSEKLKKDMTNEFK